MEDFEGNNLIAEMEVNLVNSSATCWFCRKTGHIRDDCREFARLLDYFAKLFGVNLGQWKATNAKGKPKKDSKGGKGKNKKQTKKVQAIPTTETTEN